MRLLLDIVPLAIFFIAYQMGGLMAATASLIVATGVSLAVTYLLYKKVALNPLISGLVVALFGGLTLALQDDVFIKMKPTLVNTLFAVILLGGLAFGKSLLRYLLEVAIQLTDEGWRKLTFRWGIFFLFLAGVNEYIWRNYDEAFWVNFKVFGMLPLTMVFMLSQLPLIQKHMIAESEE